MLIALLWAAGCRHETPPPPVEHPHTDAAIHACAPGPLDSYACDEPISLPEFGEPYPIAAVAGPFASPFDLVENKTFTAVTIALESMESACETWLTEYSGEACPSQGWAAGQSWTRATAFGEYTELSVWSHGVDVGWVPEGGFESVGVRAFFEGPEMVGMLVSRYQEHSALWCVNEEYFAATVVYGDAEAVLGCSYDDDGTQP